MLSGRGVSREEEGRAPISFSEEIKLIQEEKGTTVKEQVSGQHVFPKKKNREACL